MTSQPAFPSGIRIFDLANQIGTTGPAIIAFLNANRIWGPTSSASRLNSQQADLVRRSRQQLPAQTITRRPTSEVPQRDIHELRMPVRVELKRPQVPNLPEPLYIKAQIRRVTRTAGRPPRRPTVAVQSLSGLAKTLYTGTQTRISAAEADGLNQAARRWAAAGFSDKTARRWIATGIRPDQASYLAQRRVDPGLLHLPYEQAPGGGWSLGHAVQLDVNGITVKRAYDMLVATGQHKAVEEPTVVTLLPPPPVRPRPDSPPIPGAVFSSPNAIEAPVSPMTRPRSPSRQPRSGPSASSRRPRRGNQGS